MATGNPANSLAVLGRSITFALTGQGASIAAFNRDLDTQVDTWDVKHTIKTMTREPSGATHEAEQYVSDNYDVTLSAEQVRSTFLKISKHQTAQARNGQKPDLLHLTLKTVFADGSSDVERYIDGTVTMAGRKGGKMSAAASSNITIRFQDCRD